MIKLTNPDVIQKREQELLDAIAGSLDWATLVDLIRERHRLDTILGITSRSGDIVAVEADVAYQLDFEIRAVCPILFDRSGNYLEPPARKATPAAAEPGRQPIAVTQATGTVGAAGRRSDPDDGTVSLEQILSQGPGTAETVAPPEPRRTAVDPGRRMQEMASDLADMISEINGESKDTE